MTEDTQYSDHTLSAYLDRELPPAEMRLIREAVESDAELANRLAGLEEPDRIIKSAYRSIDSHPLPESIAALLREDETQAGESATGRDETVIAFPVHRAPERLYRWALPLAASIALVIGLGVGAGVDWRGGNGGNVGVPRMAAVIASGDPLFEILERGESARKFSLEGEVAVTPVLTFATESGAFCREFEMLSPGAAMRAVACREDDSWRLTVAVSARPEAGAGEGYVTAEGATGAWFDRYLGTLIDGAPLGADEEKALIECGWQDAGDC